MKGATIIFYCLLTWHNAFFIFWSNTLTPSADSRGWERVSTVCSCDGSLCFSRRLTIWKVIKFNKSMQWRQQSFHVEQDFWLFSHDAIAPIKYLHFPGRLHKTAGTFVIHTLLLLLLLLTCIFLILLVLHLKCIRNIIIFCHVLVLCPAY